MMRPLKLSFGLTLVALLSSVTLSPALAERKDSMVLKNGVYTPNFGKKTNFNRNSKVNETAKKPVVITPPPLDRVIVQDLGPPAPPVGNLVYKPEKLEPLTVQKFAGPAPAEALAAAIHSGLLNTLTTIRATAADRTAIAAHYEATSFKPLWTDETGVNARGQEILAALAASAADGMDPQDYLPPAMGSFSDDPTLNRGDVVHLANIELGITAAALKYARHASGGRLIPNRLTTYNDIKPSYVEPATALKVLATTPFIAAYLQGLQPKHPAFAAFKAELAELRENLVAEVVQPIPSGQRVRPGESDPRIPQMREWLKRIGYSGLQTEASGETTASIDAPSIVTGGELFDPQLEAAVKAFQTDAGLKVSGYLDKLTVAALNRREPRGDEQRILANMERLRWLPKDLGSRYVFVNQAAFGLQVVDSGKEVWRTKVVVGTPNNQTAAFHDRMETVVFNPSWGVPQSIITKEMLPELRKDPSYLDRKGFRVTDLKGNVLRSSAINWYAYGDKPPFNVQQPPSGDNALGDIKFLFPNAHAIYMHDTPEKQLFARNMRAFSHGCVRVENPRDFAAVLLNRTRPEIDAEIDGGRSHTTPVGSDIKVHITYFTAWPSEDGRIIHYNDVYDRDNGITGAFGAMAVAAN